MKLRDLKPQAKNARFMTAAQMKRLTENVRRDGHLTSSILVYAPEGEPMEILSGHHRVDAALAAGLEQSEAHVITTPLSEERKTAIQPSHNAVTGQDDPAQLAELYQSLSELDERLYSGLTDDDVQKFQGLDILDLAAAQPEHQEITLLFLAGHEKAFREALASIEKAVKTKHPTIYHLACAEDFDQLFEAIIAVKAHTNVFNSATALRIVAELALERLADISGTEEAPVVQEQSA